MNIDYAPGRRAPAPLICRRSLLALRLVMGKKSRAVPGRRPILQLSPPGPRSSTPGRDPDPDPDPEADSTAAAAAATSQSAPAAATAAAATSPAVPATAAPEDSPSEGKGAREGPCFYLGRLKLEHGACGLGLGVSSDPVKKSNPGGRGTPRLPAIWGPRDGGRGLWAAEGRAGTHLRRHCGAGFSPGNQCSPPRLGSPNLLDDPLRSLIMQKVEGNFHVRALRRLSLAFNTCHAWFRFC